MPRFDFSLAVENASIGAPTQASAARNEPSAPAPDAVGRDPIAANAPDQPPAPPPKRSLARRALRKVFGRLAEAARGFLTARVEGRFDLLQDRVVHIEGAVDRVEKRLEQLTRLEMQFARLEMQFARLEMQFARLEMQFVRGGEQIEARLNRDQTTQADSMAALQVRLLEPLGAVGPKLDRVETVGIRALELLGAYGPRFDELEIKARPFFRFDDGVWAVRFSDGFVLLPNDDPAFALNAANAHSRGFEPGVRAVLERLVQPGMRVADVGANIGLLTLALGRLCGPAGRVYAFEPEPRFHALLPRMCALNGLSWVDVRAIAAGRSKSRAVFHVSSIPGHSSLYELPAGEAARTFEVDVIPLDDALAGAGRIDLVKMDVEGAELDVLAGMGGIVASNPDVAVIAEFGPSHLRRVGLEPDGWFEAFARCGLAAFAIEESIEGRVAAVEDVGRLADMESVNIAFVRPGSTAHARLLS
jgi:FkbM family methyltransferase